MLILLFEDEPVIAQLLCEVVEESGHHALCATNAAEALQLCQRFQPAFALLNFRTGAGPDGTTLAREIRKRFRTRILFVTGARLQDISDIFTCESDYPVLFKPFTRQQFRRVFATMMTGSRDAG